jgi:hypothetical protein
MDLCLHERTTRRRDQRAGHHSRTPGTTVGQIDDLLASASVKSGAWENLLADIKGRGVQEIELWIRDGHQAILNAIEWSVIRYADNRPAWQHVVLPKESGDSPAPR